MATSATTPSTTLLLDGVERCGHGDDLPSFNPATGEQICVVRSASPDQVDQAVQAARVATHTAREMPREERSAMLQRLADQLDNERDRLLSVIVEEVGTPVSLARGLQVDTAIATLRWFADAALLDRNEDLGSSSDEATRARITYEPVGAIAAVTAYNYPVLTAVAKLGAALAAGCSVVLLPSDLAPLSTLALVEMVRAADVPAGVINILAGGPEVGRQLTAHPGIDKVSFTGSVDVGRRIMAQAAPNLTDIVLELGGKSVGLVLPDCELDEVVAALHHRYLRNAGQGCASPTRLLVESGQYDKFVELSRSAYEHVAIGDPWDPATLVGPVISERHRERVLGLISSGLADGGTIVAERRVEHLSQGWYVPPTLVGDLPNSARLNQEEVFGPVATLQRYASIDEAVEVAEDSIFGLHAHIFGDHDLAMATAGQLRVGTVSINGGSGGGLRLDAPIGGFKHSGIGREYGEAGVREFLESRSIVWREAGR